MKLKTAILIAMRAASEPVGNEDLRRMLGRLDAPKCTITWHLNELADFGAVECDDKGRWNRWRLTEYGQQLAEAAWNGADGIVARKLAHRRAPPPQSVDKLAGRAPRSVFELGLMVAQRDQIGPFQRLQMELWEVA